MDRVANINHVFEAVALVSRAESDLLDFKGLFERDGQPIAFHETLPVLRISVNGAGPRGWSEMAEPLMGLGPPRVCLVPTRDLRAEIQPRVTNFWGALSA